MFWNAVSPCCIYGCYFCIWNYSNFAMRNMVSGMSIEFLWKQGLYCIDCSLNDYARGSSPSPPKDVVSVIGKEGHLDNGSVKV